MQLCAAIVTIKQIRLAVVLVEIESTRPQGRDAALAYAEKFFPILPIILLSPRVGGFSHSYATFELDLIISLINADDIAWTMHVAPVRPNDLPF